MMQCTYLDNLNNQLLNLKKRKNELKRYKNFRKSTLKKILDKINSIKNEIRYCKLPYSLSDYIVLNYLSIYNKRSNTKKLILIVGDGSERDCERDFIDMKTDVSIVSVDPIFKESFFDNENNIRIISGKIQDLNFIQLAKYYPLVDCIFVILPRAHVTIQDFEVNLCKSFKNLKNLNVFVSPCCGYQNYISGVEKKYFELRSCFYNNNNYSLSKNL